MQPRTAAWGLVAVAWVLGCNARATTPGQPPSPPHAPTTAPRAAAADAITFRFAPPLPSTQISTSRQKTSYRLSDGQTMSVEQRYVHRFDYAAADEGINVTITPVEFQVHQDGVPLDDPLMAVDFETVIELELDDAGTIRAVKGYETYTQRIRAAMIPHKHSTFTANGDPATDAIRRVHERWDDLRGPYMGATLQVGETMRRSLDRGPATRELDVFVVACRVPEHPGDAPWIRVDCGGANDLAFFEASFDGPLPGTGSDEPYAREASIAWQSTRQVDPRTGLLVQERMTHVLRSHGVESHETRVRIMESGSPR